VFKRSIVTSYSYTETVSYLLCVNGVDGSVDLANDIGRTCLHIAVMNDNLSLINTLVKQHGASIDTRMQYKVGAFV